MSVAQIAAPEPGVLPQPATAHATDRIHYLDNLRALAMLLGVFLHAALAYADPTQLVWLVTDSQSSVLVDASFQFIHLFRMGLFFLISGYFAKLLITRRGVKKFVWNRTVRIVFPFLLFYPCLLALVTLALIFAMSYVSHPLGLMGVIVKASREGSASSQKQPLSTMHLWFLYYLVLLAALSVVLSRFRGPGWDRLFRRHWLLALAPMALLPGLLLGGLGIPAPESFIPQVWPFLFYGLFYWAGWQLFGREACLAPLQSWIWGIAATSCVLFVPYYLLLPKVDASIFQTGAMPRLSQPVHLVEGVLTVYLASLLTLLSLLIGQRYLSGRSSILRLISDASYWIYLVHLPMVYFLQTIMAETQFALGLKLFFTTGGTFLFCMTTYLVFVRYTPIGWLLNGKRAFP
jgi:surface polysaccharide O-acyltransferase-like enzyme